MTQNQPDRLDRIEATLERVSQQLDNQVVVNAELRQSTAQLRQSTAELTNSVTELTNSVTELTSSVSSLIGIANQHQENFMVLVTEIRNVRVDMQEMQSENQRILNRIERLENEH